MRMRVVEESMKGKVSGDKGEALISSTGNEAVAGLVWKRMCRCCVDYR
jgi:hypothetical protein